MEKTKAPRFSWQSLASKLLMPLGLVAFAVATLCAQASLWARPQSSNDLSQQIFDTMLKVHGTQPRTRPVHAKGIVCQFVQDGKPTPDSFATESFLGNNALVFVNKKGAKQAFRYQILPVAGSHYLDDAAVASKSPEYLFDELKVRLAKGPVKFRLVAQLPGPGDPTNDSSMVWLADRKTVDLGTITLSAVVADSDAAQRALAFDPILLTTGIELSDDPLPELRSAVYGLSAMHR